MPRYFDLARPGRRQVGKLVTPAHGPPGERVVRGTSTQQQVINKPDVNLQHQTQDSVRRLSPSFGARPRPADQPAEVLEGSTGKARPPSADWRAQTTTRTI